jgi:hypothetical protein
VKCPKLRMAKASRTTDRRRRDGSSFERAILVDQSLWRARHCRGAELLLQQLMSHEGRYFEKKAPWSTVCASPTSIASISSSVWSRS